MEKSQDHFQNAIEIKIDSSSSYNSSYWKLKKHINHYLRC